MPGKLGKTLIATAIVGAIAGGGRGAAAQELLPDGLPVAEYPESLRFPSNALFSDVPSQTVFEGWPPRELLQQPFWLPWGDLTFNRARLFNRPVLFVMVTGWSVPAQRMLRETLSTGTVLSQANQSYITLLVNADRRPDLKERYQTGALPVIAFLLPNAQPMLSQANDLGKAQPIVAGDVDVRGMLFLLTEGDKYWQKWPDLLMQVAAEWTRREAVSDAAGGVPDELAADSVEAWLLGNADRSEGGFGAAPKFLVSGLTEFAALRAARLRPALERHSRLTLDKLIESPLYDSGGGGLYRLAAEPDWGGIAAEKLLTTNTILVQQLTLRLQLEDDPAARDRLQRALVQTTGFLTGRLGRPGGGFYNAESPPPSIGPGDLAPESEPESDAAAKPSIDRLVLAGPNALAGAALLRAGTLLDDEAVFDAGRRAVDLVLEQAILPGRGTRHVIDPDPNDRIFLTAHADVALGLVDAYESLGDPRLLDAAVQVAEFASRNLRHEDEDALRDRLEERGALGLLANPRRPIIPNVRLARAFLRLGHQRGEPAHLAEAERLLRAFAGNLAAYRVHGTEPALAVEELVRDPLLVTVHGTPDAKRTVALRRAALTAPWPWTLVRVGESAGRPRAELAYGASNVVVTDAERLDAAIREVTGGDGT